MKWHKYPKEIPEVRHKSYLILNHFGNIAEADFRNEDEWFQYNESVHLGADAVVAWCDMKDIDKPDFCEDN